MAPSYITVSQPLLIVVLFGFFWPGLPTSNAYLVQDLGRIIYKILYNLEMKGVFVFDLA